MTETQEGAQLGSWLLKVCLNARQKAQLSSAQLSSAQLSSRHAKLPPGSQAQTYLVDRILPSRSSSVPTAAGEAEEGVEEAKGSDELDVTADMP